VDFNKYAFSEQFFSIRTQFPGDGIKKRLMIHCETAKFNTVDPYLTAVYNSDFGLNLNVVRDNMHSVYGDHFVYNKLLSLSKLPLKVWLHTVRPILHQACINCIHLMEFLAPEENSTVEAGLKLLINKKLNFNVVVFIEKRRTCWFYTNPTTYVKLC
jgi:vitamin B12 transporter